MSGETCWLYSSSGGQFGLPASRYAFVALAFDRLASFAPSYRSLGRWLSAKAFFN
jgi:hypothetical protein